RRVCVSVYCPTMPAALISGTHLSTSLLTSMRSASGERCSGEGMSAPISPSRLAIVGSCIAFCTASLTFATIAAGVFFGANKAVQATVSSFVSPPRPMGRRHVRDGRRALRDGDDDRIFAAVGDMRRCRDDLVEQQINLAAKEIIGGFRQATIGNVHDIGAGQMIEQQRGQMR